MGTQEILKHDVDVVVATGTGAADFPTGYPINGEIRQVSVNAPSEDATYTITIQDPNDFILYKEANIIGDVTISMIVYVNCILTITIASATDGTYGIRIYSKAIR